MQLQETLVAIIQVVDTVGPLSGATPGGALEGEQRKAIHTPNQGAHAPCEEDQSSDEGVPSHTT